ncbi:TPA: hypothetical protein N0F65_007950 [Lagenidium giganteum]|uniref:Fido domain-containing protein n=1 Tax=Lagenidium giganteum TaxID=4803 RepID=A0AAV2YGV2_9STRA|nr:TPA: hypothetical protein N0F65_007950 [Lagenidium giganteum]
MHLERRDWALSRAEPAETRATAADVMTGMTMGQLTHTTAMCWAAAEGDIDMMEKLRDLGADVNASDYDKRTPLHIAVSDNQLEAVEFLLKCGAQTNVVDRWGRSPVDCALDAKNARILSLLERVQFAEAAKAASHARVGLERKTSANTDTTALFRAIEQGDTESVKRAWLDGVELNATDENGRTSLHVAVENGQIGVIELLLSADVNVTVIDRQGRSPLSICIEKQLFHIADMLRAHQKATSAIHASSDVSDQHRVARAFDATKRGDLDALKHLVPGHVHPDVQDYDLRTLLHIASAEGHLKLARYLVECGANVNLLDRWGTSPLSEAVDFAHNKVARFLIANHATESGNRATVSIDQIDNATLNTALEFTLRVVTRRKWLMGQVYCPMKGPNDNCILVAHSIWHKNDPMLQNHRRRSSVESDASSGGEDIVMSSSSLWNDPIQMFRKVGSLMMIDPGQGHTGRVFSAQHPEWMNLNNVLQSDFFMLPHARRAGIQTIVSVPMIYKMSTIAVLSWYSEKVTPEDPLELQRIQRLLRSVTILSTLRQELLAVANNTTGLMQIPRFQYCQSLDNAITCSGDLLEKSLTEEDIRVGDAIPLALEWKLFDFVHKLATSMSSEDHTSVISLLRSMVELMGNGIFDDVISDEKLQGTDVECPVDGQLNSKSSLLLHLRYYLLYLLSVSPTEGNIFMEVNTLLPMLNRALHRSKDGDNTAENNHDLRVSIDTPPAPVAVVPSPKQPECVLCKFNVPGHIHPGRAAPSTPSAAPPSKPMFTATSKLASSDRFFGVPGSPKSPVMLEIEKLREKLEVEYDSVSRRGVLNDRVLEGSKPASFTSSELYDAIGAAHETPASRGGGAGVDARQQLLEVLNQVLEDNSCLISYNQLLEIHKCLVPASSGQAGIVRTSAAVGYASPRIYRVFLPAGEIQEALNQLVAIVNNQALWKPRPLLCAYYAFAVLVFYIHPFHDGNGRCARLVGNLLAKKFGYPAVFRAADKTIQLPEFLHKAIVAMEMLQNSKRQNRQSRILAGARKEGASMWF